jgi:ankyrin repeat protein
MKKLILTILFFISTYILFAQNMNDSLLYQAVVNNDTTTIQDLVGKGGNVNFVKQQGWVKVNLLITAVNKKNIEAVKVLLQNGADVNWEDGFNTTALMYAASIGNIPIIKHLLDNGADIKHKDKQGNDAISTAKQAKQNDVVKLLEATLKERK